MKLVITGGHLAPAVACIDTIIAKKAADIIFIGRKYNTTEEKSVSLEFNEITRRNIPFYHLIAGRTIHSVSFPTLANIVLIPLGFFHSLFILLKEKPHAILSFGGYIALPVAYMGFLLGIPVFTHEQTTHPGLTNKLISIIAKKVFVSFEDTKKMFPKQKVMVTGNPVRPQVFSKTIIDTSLKVHKTKPVIYITGGSLGSHSINVHIKNILPSLVKNHIVIHQTGNVVEYHDFSHLKEAARNLASEEQERYILREHISSEDIGYIYSIADIVVSRAGANTFAELVALQLPAVIIPLPWSAYGEQQQHAEILAVAGVAEVFDQSHESGELLEKITTVMNNRESYKKNFHKLHFTQHSNAAETIIHKIIENK